MQRVKFWMAVTGIALVLDGSPAGAAKILGVEEKQEVRSAPVVNDARGRRLNKFTENLETTVTRFSVEWEAAAADRGSVTAQFQFRTAAGPDAEVNVLNQGLEGVEPGRRISQFDLPAGRRAQAWRVRLIKGGRVIAERASANWE